MKMANASKTHIIRSSDELCPHVAINEWCNVFPIVDHEYVWIYPLIRNEDLKIQELFNKCTTPRTSSDFALYIHVPACVYHCPMCAFYHEIVRDRSELNWYPDTLIRELEMYSPACNLNNLNLRTIYFGGGTATLLEPKSIGKIVSKALSLFRSRSHVEITVEGHPSTVDINYLLALRDNGVNRVSFGVQSFNDNFLEMLKLKQTCDVNVIAIKNAINAGFNTVAIDLLYRIPGQSISALCEDINRALDLGITSISAYSLEPSEKQTKVLNCLPSEAINKEMFFFIHDFMLEKGWSHVAQPDYAAPGHEHIELQVSWKAPQGDNLSIGAGAWSVFNGVTFCNVHSLSQYKKVVEAGAVPILSGQRHTLEDCMSRYPVLGVRCFNIENGPFLNAFGVNLIDKFHNEIKLLESIGLVRLNNENLSVTRTGKYFVDNISKAFYTPENQGYRQPWGGYASGFVAEKYFDIATQSMILL